jgi:5-methylcytosine-specific restriction endonuclease McrA
MPNLPRPDRRKDKPRRTERKPSNQEFYNSTGWRKTRAYYLAQYPLCEVSLAEGRTVPGEVIDHIIPISVGGAKMDARNFMTLSKQVHDKKSALEAHVSPLVAWDYNDSMEKIPAEGARWNMIYKLLKYVL